MTMTAFEYKIPTWALCPLENGDYSGITDEEQALLDDFIESCGEVAMNAAVDCDLPIMSWHWSHGREEYFHWTNDIQRGMGGDVVDSFLVVLMRDR